jgi:hypothetical protein
MRARPRPSVPIPRHLKEVGAGIIQSALCAAAPISLADAHPQLARTTLDGTANQSSILLELNLGRRVGERFYVPLTWRSAVRAAQRLVARYGTGVHILRRTYPVVHQGRDWAGPQRTLSSSQRPAAQIARAG